MQNPEEKEEIDASDRLEVRSPTSAAVQKKALRPAARVTERFAAVLSRWHTWQLVNTFAEPEAQWEALKRIRAGAVVIAPLDLLLAAWFYRYPVRPAQPQLADWAYGLYITHVVAALALALLALMAHRLVLPGKPMAEHEPGAVAGDGITRYPWCLTLARGVQLAFCLLILVYGMVCAALDVRIGLGVSTFALVAGGVAAFSLMPPLQFSLLYAVGMGGFWLSLPYFTADSVALDSYRLQTLGAGVMAEITSLLIWKQFTRAAVLRRNLHETNQVLTAQQAELLLFAERDPLTGLLNRRRYVHLCEVELSRALRYPACTSMLMLDIDHFKKINDLHGHPGGDEVLEQIAQRLTACVRSTDLLARLGGEEFAVLMPGTSLQGAQGLAEKLRQAIRGTPMTAQGGGVTVTVSVGLAWARVGELLSFDALYKRADQALYRAKADGRDRVQVEDDASLTPQIDVPTARRSRPQVLT